MSPELVHPQTISVAELSITADGKPSEMVALRDGKMVWRGSLAAKPTALEIAYTSVGKGLYELSVPPGGILDSFRIKLAANGSDVRLLEDHTWSGCYHAVIMVREGGNAWLSSHFPIAKRKKKRSAFFCAVFRERS